MKRIDEICKRYNIALCYLFGSQKEKGLALLEGKPVTMDDPESDIDFGVLFKEPPDNILDTYASISLELQELVAPFKADLLFLHECDHLIQLEVIKGVNLYSIDNAFKEEYEEKGYDVCIR